MNFVVFRNGIGEPIGVQVKDEQVEFSIRGYPVQVNKSMILSVLETDNSTLYGPATYCGSTYKFKARRQSNGDIEIKYSRRQSPVTIRTIEAKQLRAFLLSWA